MYNSRMPVAPIMPVIAAPIPLNAAITPGALTMRSINVEHTIISKAAGRNMAAVATSAPVIPSNL